MIGVNRFASPSAPIEVFRSDPAGEQRQRESLAAVRARRSQDEVERCLDLVEACGPLRRERRPGLRRGGQGLRDRRRDRRTAARRVRQLAAVESVLSVLRAGPGL